MPGRLICCISLPPATIFSVPNYEYAIANQGLQVKSTEEYYPCCGKSICGGCVHSFRKSGNIETCPFCKSDGRGKTDLDRFEEMMKRVEVNDANSIYALGNYYYHGQLGLLQDHERAMELWNQAAKLGSSSAHFHLGIMYHEGGNMKKEKFHYEAAAMAGHEVARNNLGTMEAQSGNIDRAVKHWMISASAGHCDAMHNLLIAFKQGLVSRESMDSTLTVYNNACVEMRSEARDAWIRKPIG
jgi:TPR repeat protein